MSDFRHCSVDRIVLITLTTVSLILNNLSLYFEMIKYVPESDGLTVTILTKLINVITQGKIDYRSLAIFTYRLLFLNVSSYK